MKASKVYQGRCSPEIQIKKYWTNIWSQLLTDNLTNKNYIKCVYFWTFHLLWQHFWSFIVTASKILNGPLINWRNCYISAPEPIAKFDSNLWLSISLFLYILVVEWACLARNSSVPTLYNDVLSSVKYKIRSAALSKQKKINGIQMFIASKGRPT